MSLAKGGRLLHNEQLKPPAVRLRRTASLRNVKRMSNLVVVRSQSRRGGTGLVLAKAFSRRLLAESHLRKHHIFMQTLAGLRWVNRGCSDARCFAASPLWFVPESLLSDWRKIVPRLWSP